jgi:hypothetical protein
MELVSNNEENEFLFRFDKYVTGWDQFVGVILEGNNPQIISITWKLGNLTNVFGDDIIPAELNSTTYRKFPIGEITNQVNSYILLNKAKGASNHEDMENLDYSEILRMAQQFIFLYPIQKSKWQDERNVLYYISIYLLEVNKFEDLNHDNKLDLHNRVANRVKVSRYNSIKILDRLKKSGWLTSGGISTTLIPTLRTVKKLLDIVSEARDIFDKFEEKTHNLISDDPDTEVYDYWFSNMFLSDNPTKTAYLVDGELYDHDPYEGINSPDDDDSVVIEIEVDREDVEIEEEALEQWSEVTSHWWGIKKILDESELWKFDNKYIQSIDDDLSVEFLIDEDVMKQVRDSHKYVNDMNLFKNESKISEILVDLGLGDYFEKHLRIDAQIEKPSLTNELETLSKSDNWNENEAPF